MKLFGYTCVFNEEKMIPYVMPYVERMGYDKFYVYDDGCTDNTIEILKQYPFIEIRKTGENKTEEYNFDGRKRDVQLDAIKECFEIANHTEEDIWMTFTDFDEVIFCQRERSTTLKDYLIMETMRGYNYFDGRMLHLSWDGNKKDENLLPHQWEGVRGAWWFSEEMKATLIKVNDFAAVQVFCGNHWFGVKMKEGCHPKNLAECGEFNGFHMKYFDEKIALSKSNDKVFVCDVKWAQQIIRQTSFPLEQYFLMKGFFVKQLASNKRDCGEGLFLF